AGRKACRFEVAEIAFRARLADVPDRARHGVDAALLGHRLGLAGEMQEHDVGRGPEALWMGHAARTSCSSARCMITPRRGVISHSIRTLSGLTAVTVPSMRSRKV